MTSANNFTVTIKNNTGSTVNGLPALTTGNLVLSGPGAPGITVSSVSPAGTYSLAAGATKTFIYTLGGTPTSTGTLTATWNYSDYTNSKTANVQNLTSGGTAVIALNNCSWSGTGTLTAGTQTSGVTQSIWVNVTQPGDYNITTTTANGVTFSNSGTLTSTGLQPITLAATGTPVTAGTFSYTLNNVTPNCSFNRTAQFNTSSNGTSSISVVSCNSSAFGDLTAGVPVSGVSQVITVNVTQTGTYSISTNTVNGVTFSRNDTFTSTGNQPVTLYASGTPTSVGSSTYTLNIPANCTFSRLNQINPSSKGTAALTYTSCTTNQAGNIVQGIGVNGVSQTITVNVTFPGTYTISTFQNNGITFSRTDTFTSTGIKQVVLNASGTPSSAGEFNYVLNTTPNCNFNRTAITAVSCDAYTNQSSQNIMIGNQVVTVTRSGGYAMGSVSQCSLSANGVVNLDNNDSVTYTFSKPISNVTFYGFNFEESEAEGFSFEGFNNGNPIGISETITQDNCEGFYTDSDKIKLSAPSSTDSRSFAANIYADSVYFTSITITRIGGTVGYPSNSHRISFCNTTVAP